MNDRWCVEAIGCATRHCQYCTIQHNISKVQHSRSRIVADGIESSTPKKLDRRVRYGEEE
jgi:hypothetical protein